LRMQLLKGFFWFPFLLICFKVRIWLQS